MDKPPCAFRVTHIEKEWLVPAMTREQAKTIAYHEKVKQAGVPEDWIWMKVNRSPEHDEWAATAKRRCYARKEVFSGPQRYLVTCPSGVSPECKGTRPTRPDRWRKAQANGGTMICHACNVVRMGRASRIYPQPDPDGKFRYPCPGCGVERAVSQSMYAKDKGQPTICSACRPIKPDRKPYDHVQVKKLKPHEYSGCQPRSSGKEGHPDDCALCAYFDKCLDFVALRTNWRGWVRTGEPAIDTMAMRNQREAATRVIGGEVRLALR